MPTEDAVNFFHHNAGFGYDPKVETREQGRQRGAEALALAEEQGRDAGLSFQWDREDDGSTDWVCLCRDMEGQVVGSLGGVDFGDDCPWSSSYRRVVEAELAQEVLE